MESRGRAALADLPAGLAGLPRTVVPLAPSRLLGVEALRQFGRADPTPERGAAEASAELELPPLASLIEELARPGRGVILTMGKGGVGKTTVAAAVAVELARRGHRVHLTTTDPAAHVEAAVNGRMANLHV